MPRYYYCIACFDLRYISLDSFFDPTGHGRIGGQYFNVWCPYVPPSQKQKCATLTLATGQQNTSCVKVMTIYWQWPGGSS